ncbi:hypothetical protein Rsub_11698 [Raphidocelis subcapitata]|uniref:Uncharacterized protein n=1 Tax=Raphidocelis subcapitata TaxID=307507 RepID=A0A2V0PF65_9CHLO|nr:hypothetical protein Rsub_11698 [Raphidocelis subcapitata]|eukprot:GBF98488.1 hypothetical protein Rsub_11698 [Raphidocelis subcapitata]
MFASGLARAPSPSGGLAPPSGGPQAHPGRCHALSLRRGAPQPRQHRRRSRSPPPARWAGDREGSVAVEAAAPEEAAYRELLQRAEAGTFAPPESEEREAASRRAGLQDAERLLRRAAALRPHDMGPRVLLARNLMIQDGGREADVPAVALDALRALAASDAGADPFSPAFVPAMQLMLLALKALWACDAPGEVPALLAAAARHAPALAPDFESLAARVESQLGGCAARGRAALLSNHTFLSCVDLQAVRGRHHAAAAGLESFDGEEGAEGCVVDL